MIVALNVNHDSSFAWVDGDDVHLVELDRLTGIKHVGPSAPCGVITRAITRLGVDPELVNALGVIDVVRSTLGDRRLTLYLDKLAYDVSQVAKALRLMGYELMFVDHQLSHVNNVIWFNALDDAVVVSLDGLGDGCGAVADVRDGRIVDLVHRRSCSLGELYEYLTNYFVNQGGSRAPGREGTFMAYAGLGRCVSVDAEWWRMISRFTAYNVPWAGTSAEQMVYRMLDDLVTRYDRRDVAHSVHELWVDTAVDYVGRHADRRRTLALTGGCALNCRLNQRLLMDRVARRVVWTPTPGDSGQPLGMLAETVGLTGRRLVTSAVRDAAWWTTSRGDLGACPVTVDELVVRLVDGEVIAVVRGEVEAGPRALGRRSILASPLNATMHDRLNAIKGRAWFRPYGVVLPREHLCDFTNLDVDVPWMNVTVCAPHGLLPAAEHVDGTTRVQTVTTDADPWLHELLTAFGDATGVYALINTSLNERSTPIVNTVRGALALRHRGVDALVVDELLVDLKR